MQFTTSFLILVATAFASAAPSTQAAVPIEEGSQTIASNSWAMQTWTGTSCTGTQLFWSAPDGYSCTNLAAPLTILALAVKVVQFMLEHKILVMDILRGNALDLSLSSVKQLQSWSLQQRYRLEGII
ncbi:hypothetical protein F4860DRAFT_515374 [Xylaria cubensis]|nr:hypothetical protein F4860DRAFT_515374 [Xylaria cubensis]